jgi:hypothetical protein
VLSLIPLQESVQLDLSSEGIQVEALDGDIPCVPVSGKTGQGIPELLENLSAIAELQDLKAERDGRAHGHILESKIEKGLGYLIFLSALKMLLIYAFLKYLSDQLLLSSYPGVALKSVAMLSVVLVKPKYG